MYVSDLDLYAEDCYDPNMHLNTSENHNVH